MGMLCKLTALGIVKKNRSSIKERGKKEKEKIQIINISSITLALRVFLHTVQELHY